MTEPENRELEALRRLRKGGYSALQSLSCNVEGPDLSIHGRLPTYYLKQVAQAIVAQVEGVRRVINHIEVESPSGRRISRV
ncbi:BON domain-containing protein [Singulisphaera rosea]